MQQDNHRAYFCNWTHVSDNPETPTLVVNFGFTPPCQHLPENATRFIRNLCHLGPHAIRDAADGTYLLSAFYAGIVSYDHLPVDKKTSASDVDADREMRKLLMASSIDDAFPVEVDPNLFARESVLVNPEFTPVVSPAGGDEYITTPGVYLQWITDRITRALHNDPDFMHIYALFQHGQIRIMFPVPWDAITQPLVASVSSTEFRLKKNPANLADIYMAALILPPEDIKRLLLLSNYNFRKCPFA